MQFKVLRDEIDTKMNGFCYNSCWAMQALRKEPLTVYGDGKQTRSFQYVSDLVSTFPSLNFFMFLIKSMLYCSNMMSFIVLWSNE